MTTTLYTNPDITHSFLRKADGGLAGRIACCCQKMCGACGRTWPVGPLTLHMAAWTTSLCAGFGGDFVLTNPATGIGNCLYLYDFGSDNFPGTPAPWRYWGLHLTKTGVYLGRFTTSLSWYGSDYSYTFSSALCTSHSGHTRTLTSNTGTTWTVFGCTAPATCTVDFP